MLLIPASYCPLGSSLGSYVNHRYHLQICRSIAQPNFSIVFLLTNGKDFSSPISLAIANFYCNTRLYNL